MFARFCALRMGAVMSCGLLLPAALLPGETDLLNQEQGQQRIEDSTATSAALLAELVDEFGRNDLKGSDVEILSGIQKVIGNVSGDLMPEIVGQLNAARTELQWGDLKTKKLTSSLSLDEVRPASAPAPAAPPPPPPP